MNTYASHSAEQLTVGYGESFGASTDAPGDLSGPSPPRLTLRDLRQQAWVDAQGKEVQSAATYSHTWLANQFGHVCLGILAAFVVTWISGRIVYGYQALQAGAGLREIALAALGAPYTAGRYWGLVLPIIAVGWWEWRAYRNSVKSASGTFPLDTKTLRGNAFVAAAYMALGVVLGFAFHTNALYAALLAGVVVVIAVLLAPPWLRQKIIWQKGAMPYLFRLADIAPAISRQDVTELQSLIDKGAPPDVTPHQIVVGGPIGSGRTSMAAGIGTEFAFKGIKVRYLSLNALLEFAVTASGHRYPDDAGPTSIGYWPWSEAQVVIIDDVGPLIASHQQEQGMSLTRFRAILANDLSSIRHVLGRCHTVWVIGELRPPYESGTLTNSLDDFAKEIAGFCTNTQSPCTPIVIELDPPEASELRTSKPLAPVIRNVRRLHQS